MSSQQLSSAATEDEESAISQQRPIELPPTHGIEDSWEVSSSTTAAHEMEAKSQSSTDENQDVVIEDASIEDSSDPDIVGWDGADDPECTLNWPAKTKWTIAGLLSAMSFITPLASSMFAPGVDQVLSEFNTTSNILASLVVSIYILGYVVGPLILAPLSEMYGRLYIYHGSNFLFVIFTIACAVSDNLSMLIVFRFLSGAVGSAPLTIGGGTFGDLFSVTERGAAMSIWALGPLLGPVIGGAAGGFLAHAEGWRWVFWVIAIASGVLTAAVVVFMRETYTVVLLERKVKRLRKETGNPNLKSALSRGLPTKELWKRSIVRPIKMLFLSPIILSLSTFMAFIYGILYLLFTTITEVFVGIYGFSPGVAGLAFLGLGVGMMIGLVTFGLVSDKIIKKLSTDGVAKPEYRLPPMIPGAVFVPIGLFVYGWTTEHDVHWIVPIIGCSFIGIGLITTFMPISSYLVDAFTIYSSSALAANTVLRSLFGALLPLAGPPMYQALGLGWGNSLLGFIALAMVPMPLLFWKYGEAIRTSKRFHVEF
ncbi:MFS transporter [Xylogone sp. PMI_703]|nr:MFS transporter [Xylogone sp. PMI_703]